MIAPYMSNASAFSLASLPGIGATVPDAADGWTISFFSFCLAGGGVCGGVGGASCFFVSNEPTCSWALYFLRMLSL